MTDGPEASAFLACFLPRSAAREDVSVNANALLRRARCAALLKITQVDERFSVSLYALPVRTGGGGRETEETLPYGGVRRSRRVHGGALRVVTAAP